MKKSEAKQILANILDKHVNVDTNEKIAEIILEVLEQLNFLPPARQVPVKIQTYPEHTWTPEKEK